MNDLKFVCVTLVIFFKFYKNYGFWFGMFYINAHVFCFLFQGYELLKTSLNDSAEKVCTSARQVFLPSFALWAVELHRLEHNLLHSILGDLEDLVKALPCFPCSASCLAVKVQVPLSTPIKKHIHYFIRILLTDFPLNY